ncbi:WD40-repeat-containing domain protein [Russula brevipes]|nr:WD40-repeat-containing domain protein [Russula brevipes]
MSQKLEYQERYQRLAHESSINTMVLSPNGRRLVTGGDDSVVLVWSTQSGITLFRIKAHSPILSLAWLRNTNGFIFGCQNGLLASVDISDSEGHSAAVRCISPNFNDTFPISAGKDEVKVWRRKRQGDQQECWELKVNLPPPSTIDFRREVEVTSVNWESQDAAADASLAFVSYRWHGIICWDVTKMTVLWQLPMEGCDTLSLSPDGMFAVTYGMSKNFEVRELKSGAVQSMQWHAPVAQRHSVRSPQVDPTKALSQTQPYLIKNHPVCFAHEGFAVAGAASDTKVYVWDAERGDLLLSLDHGEGSKVRTLMTAFLDEDDKFLIVTGTEKQGSGYLFLWVTVPSSVVTSSYTNGRQRIELSFTQNFWVNVFFMAVLAALSLRWIMYPNAA